MKNQKTIVIDGVTYEFKNFTPLHNDNLDIFDLYKNPSSIKCGVYMYWKNKLNRIYWINGNCMQFTIYGNIYDKNNICHDVKITKWHNYIM